MTTTTDFRPAMFVHSRECKAVIQALAVIWEDLSVTQVADIACELNVPLADFFGATDAAFRPSTGD